MKFDEWEPIYEAILADMGYDRTGDESSRDWLATRVQSLDRASTDCAGTVAIAGAAPTLEDEASLARRADHVVAASDAGARLDAVGVRPDLVVTDLDGDPAATVELARDGVPVVVHAHGDNRDALERWVPEIPSAALYGTTQAAPIGSLVNVGGFTDGDRAAFLADHLGAHTLTFPGWAFDVDDSDKRRKLHWAARLLHWLERRRDESFTVLDGRREQLSLAQFPDP